LVCSRRGCGWWQGLCLKNRQQKWRRRKRGRRGRDASNNVHYEVRSFLFIAFYFPNSSPCACAHRSELLSIKVGQADPRILDAVKVPAYGGAPLPFSGVAQAAARDGNVLIVSVFDQQLLPAVQKAISSASLGLNPIVEGSFLRIPIPKVTADARAVISDRVAALGEGALQPPQHCLLAA
jgi:hypothetical protein